MGRLEQHHYEYVKLGLAPWAVSEKPPLAIRKLWLGKLLTDFGQWRAQLQQRHSDFYLAIWLFEPAFGESQLVAAIEERRVRYQQLFGEDANKPLPAEYEAVPGIAELQWTAKKNIITYSPDDFAALGARVASKPHWPIALPGGEPGIAVQVGLVWVGQ